ncbi:PilW family protein [Kangiella sediminilitoris]|uniref:Tfp pilus assembly protein PilW-like protein n=1 Tax=Kangiella sediminilitoris TaxID=1144748 RepID=A0A1B3BBD0_9GAMM|nr:PilW family protein [Kangiella sediminilitoris]AOE50089.1 Tfp pilus assembly protein PilW-like protein [Kangiella sediminilitoris]
MTSNYNKNAGVTLVEMLIAMLIGLIILAGITVVYLSSKKTFNLGSNMVNVHENGRFAINYLVKDLQRAGWVESNVVPSEGFSLTKPLVNFKNNQTVAGGKSSDAVTVRYYGEQNCKGEIPADGIVENTYQLVPGDELSELQCNGVTLLSNVESFQLRYGVLSQDGLQYVSADMLTPQSIIKSVQVGIIVASKQKNVTTENSVTVGNVLGEGPYTFNDGRYRQVFTNTVLINNGGSLPPDELLVSE